MPTLHLPPLEMAELGPKELSILLALLVAFRAQTIPQWRLDLIQRELLPLVRGLLESPDKPEPKPSAPPPEGK